MTGGRARVRKEGSPGRARPRWSSGCSESCAPGPSAPAGAAVTGSPRWKEGDGRTEMWVRHPHLDAKTADVYGHCHREEQRPGHTERRGARGKAGAELAAGLPGRGPTDSHAQAARRGLGGWEATLPSARTGRDCPGGTPCSSDCIASVGAPSSGLKGMQTKRCLLTEPSGPRSVPHQQKPEAVGTTGTKGEPAGAHGCQPNS